MHLGNGIICPVTGVPMLIAAAGSAFWAYKKLKSDFTKDKIMPLIILSAFVFALQMINFSIPLTGSSGHVIGASLLAVILGPQAAFLSICTILLVQSLFFADGGLLALGCNIFNMGFLACFVVYPLVFKPLKNINKPLLAIILSSIVSLQLGSIFAVIETVLSGTIVSNFLNYTSLMQIIHFPIGIIEGLISACVYLVYNKMNTKQFFYSFGAVSLILASVISKYASSKPDGLEWSLLNISDSVIDNTQNILYSISESVQAKMSILTTLPDSFANVSGIVILSILVYLITLTLNNSKVKN